MYLANHSWANRKNSIIKEWEHGSIIWGASIPYFKINAPFFSSSLFFWESFNLLVRIKKMVNRTLSLGLYLSRICYLLNFLNLYIPLWLRKFFKFMVFRLLKKAFASQQTKSRHFYSCPSPPWAKLSPKFLLLPWYTGRLLISPGSICSKISPPKQKEGGENYEIKSDRIWSRRKAVIWATIKAILMTIIVSRWFLTPLSNEDPPEDLPPPSIFFQPLPRSVFVAFFLSLNTWSCHI